MARFQSVRFTLDVLAILVLGLVYVVFLALGTLGTKLRGALPVPGSGTPTGTPLLRWRVRSRR